MEKIYQMLLCAKMDRIEKKQEEIKKLLSIPLK